MAISTHTYEEIQALEIELVQPDTRKKLDRLDELLSDSFEEFGSSGKIYTKADVLRSLPQEGGTTYKLSNFAFTTLSSECILVKYRAVSSGKYTFRSSIWVCNNGSWQLLHHQATVAPTPV